MHEITILHIIRLLVGLTVQVNNPVLDFQCLARHTHTTLHIILSPVYRAGNHLTIQLRIFVNILASYRVIIIIHIPLLLQVQAGQVNRLRKLLTDGIAHAIDVFCRIAGSYRIPCRKVEHHDVIQLHLSQSGHPFVVPLRPFQVRLTVEHRQRMLRQRHVERCLRNTGTITHLAYKQIVTYQQRFFQRRRRNHIVLKEVQIHKIDCYQRKHDGIHPAHHRQHGLVGRFFPPCPGNLFGNICVKDERNHYQSQPAFQPNQENQVKHQHYAELYPLFTRCLYHTQN